VHKPRKSNDMKKLIIKYTVLVIVTTLIARLISAIIMIQFPMLLTKINPDGSTTTFPLAFIERALEYAMNIIIIILMKREAPGVGLLSVGHHPLGGAVGRDDRHLMGNVEIFANGDRGLHRRQVRIAAHDDANQGGDRGSRHRKFPENQKNTPYLTEGPLPGAEAW
jgi:hypothetical protein